MIRGKFNVVTDGAFGSCGKGAITTALAYKHRPEIISTTNLPNAGHSAVNYDGEKFVAKALPSASVLTKWVNDYRPQVLVGPTAAFQLEQLQDEIEICGVNYTLSIHPRAGVVTPEHKAAEQAGANSTRHIASTMQGAGTFQADKILRKPELKLARDYPELSAFMATNLPRRLPVATTEQDALMKMSLPEIYHHLMKAYNYTMLHEGSQGFSLDINHGHSYPQCTSRGTTAMQNMADMGISHFDLGDIYLVIRPYPIRVGNVVVDGKQLGYSGDCYDDQKETTWDQVAAEAGMPTEVAAELYQKELTTVTKRLRRVFTFSEKQLRQAALVNGATKIAINFANYIDYAVSGVNDYEKLTPKVRDFIAKVENITKLPVTIIGTGAQLDQVIIV